ncbi:dynamin family protein [Haliangium sp.]|uniref:dynamin family protein n=1 Tax=Haliangium sp. TaxID=2663208 RepID=UPI003D0DE22D
MTTSTLLEARTEAKRAIIERLTQLAEVAGAVGMETLARQIRQTRIPKLENERFYLVILGEFNHGKSTFVNALLGSEVLPMGITPTTAAINHVVWADAPRAEATLSDGRRIELSPGALADWVTVAGAHSKEVTYVEVGYPSPMLRENITLVDTPGVNDLNEARAEITYGYVPRADAVIFLLDAGQALKDSEREFLSSHVLEGSRDRMIFVLGKIDLLSEAERDAVTEYVHKGLRELVAEPALFPISARHWLEGRADQSGMPELVGHLERFLDTDRSRILLDNAAVDAGRTAAYLEQNLGVKLHAFDLDLAELEHRIAIVRSQLDASKRTLDELHVRIGAEAEAIKAQVRMDLENFTRAFLEALPAQIDAVDADDVKTYLPGFIEDKFREFAELEGHKLASLLEHLAEEVIAVTNENLEAASAALADRIGPTDAEVDIEVDSFKYDVGVYAVGALGTTVFLFINTLAGGLLTLAAPILAIVLKSKVAGDIREQAKERVPAAVRNASDAMRPHFDACVNDFATRLRGFVTSAGNALYKGISEILDQTIRERRERAGELDGLRAATSEQITAVTASRRALDQIREALWRSYDEPPPDVVGTRPGDDGQSA